MPEDCEGITEERLREARARAREAEHRVKPHVLYDAKVWRTISPQGPQDAWTCGTLPSAFPTAPSLYGAAGGGWSYIVPYVEARGPTPAAACAAFDKQWREGDSGQETED